MYQVVIKIGYDTVNPDNKFRSHDAAIKWAHQNYYGISWLGIIRAKDHKWCKKIEYDNSKMWLYGTPPTPSNVTIY